MINLIECNILPQGCDHINALNSAGAIIQHINVDLYKVSLGEPTYKIGLISDIHYNDTDPNDVVNPDADNDSDSSYYSRDLLNALTYFNEQGINNVFCCGDVSTNNINSLVTLLQGIEYWKELSESDMRITSCLGNHDWKAVYGEDEAEDLWRNNLQFPGSTEFNDAYSFHFKIGEDVFVFLSVNYNANSTHASNGLYYAPQDLDKLAELLEANKNNRVFVFTHLFFPSLAGNPSQFYTGNHEESYYLQGSQHDFLLSLLEQYPNSIWFSGHSHYHWNAQLIDSKANVAQHGGWSVHLPSLSRPISTTAQYNVEGECSEGGILEVYPDCVVIRGIVFSDNTGAYVNLKSAYANYKLNVSQSIPSEESDEVSL